MSALVYSPLPAHGAYGAPGVGLARLRTQFGSFALILAAHVLVLYGVYSGLLHRVVQAALPEEVFISVIAASAPAPTPALVPLAVVQNPPPPAITPPPSVFTVAPLIGAISVAAPAAVAADKSAPAVAFTAAAPLAAAPPAGPRTISSGVEYLVAPKPEYPALSKRMAEQGKVVLRVLVNEKGLPEQVLVQTSSGFARLDEAGRQAVLRALFKPHLEDGRPVAVFVIVPLSFQLAG